MNPRLFFKLLFLLSLFISYIFSSSSRAESDDWVRHYIGAYTIERSGKLADIAIWQQRTSVDDLHKYAKMRLNGMVRARDGSCLFSFQEVFSLPRYAFFDATMDTELLGKTEAYGIYATGFTDMLSDEQYMEQAAPVRYLRNGQVNPAYQQYKNEAYNRRNQCSSTIGKGFHLFQDAIGGQLYFGDKGRRGIPENLRPVERQAIHHQLLSLLEQYKNESIQKNGFDLSWPDMEAINAMKDVVYTSEIENSLSTRCMQRAIDARYRLFKRGVFEMSARLLDENSVLLREIKIPDEPLKSGEDRPFTANIYARDNTVHWEDIIFTTAEKASAQAHCDAADAIYQYLVALEGNKLKAIKTPDTLIDEEFDINEAYIISANGIAFVDPQEFGNGTSVINRLAVFNEGDTVYSIEKVAGFRLGLRAWLKNPLNDKYSKDYNMPIEYAALLQDANLSAKYNAQILSGTLKTFKEPVCIVYAGVTKALRCTESMPASERANEVYVVKTTKDKAIKIFNDLYPDFMQPVKPECDSLPFCKEGTRFQSAYLNAIYLQDFKTVKELDKSILNNSQKAMSNMLSAFSDGAEDVHVSIIPYLLNEYIYAYQDNPKQCFQVGSRAMTFKDYVPETSLVDGTGLKVWSAGGYARETTYKMVDADFIEVCDEVCGIREASELSSVINDFFNGPEAKYINNDMQGFMAEYACDAMEVQRFEEGLLSIYQFLSVPLEQSNRFYRSFY